MGSTAFGRDQRKWQWGHMVLKHVEIILLIGALKQSGTSPSDIRTSPHHEATGAMSSLHSARETSSLRHSPEPAFNLSVPKILCRVHWSCCSLAAFASRLASSPLCQFSRMPSCLESELRPNPWHQFPAPKLRKLSDIRNPGRRAADFFTEMCLEESVQATHT